MVAFAGASLGSRRRWLRGAHLEAGSVGCGRCWSAAHGALVHHGNTLHSVREQQSERVLFSALQELPCRQDTRSLLNRAQNRLGSCDEYESTSQVHKRHTTEVSDLRGHDACVWAEPASEVAAVECTAVEFEASEESGMRETVAHVARDTGCAGAGSGMIPAQCSTSSRWASYTACPDWWLGSSNVNSVRSTL
jgi:hypothetical protein